MPWVNRILVRAEEQVREAAMTPYAIAVLLTILTFPKPAALVAIYTLGIADPAAALVGIRFGRRKLSANRSFEGSLAFFVSTVAVAAAVLTWAHGRRAARDHRRGAHDRLAASALRAPAAPDRRQHDDPALRRLRDGSSRRSLASSLA